MPMSAGSAIRRSFGAILLLRYQDRFSYTFLITFMDQLWDRYDRTLLISVPPRDLAGAPPLTRRCLPPRRAEPAGYLNAVTKNPLPGTPPHRLLFQYGLGDAQVHGDRDPPCARA